MRGVYPLPAEDPFVTEMRSVLFATLRSGEMNYHKGFWDVFQTFGKSLEIWYGGRPVWELQVMGECENRAIPCLLAALAEAGEKREFLGGRGPAKFTYGTFTYTNHCFYPSDRKESLNFVRVYEEIRDENGRECCWNECSGKLL